jgi:diguanylate cyclase (GGDEF)-like protein/PAS domain S-box-containing protein
MRIAALEQELEATRTALDQCRERERLQRKLFEAMIEGCAVGELLMDERGRPVDLRFLEVNPAFARGLGVAPEAARGSTARELLGELDPELVHALARLARTGRPVRLAYRLRRPAAWVDLFACRPAPGKIAVLAVDITELRRTQEALRRSEARYRRQLTELEIIYRTVPIGLAVLDRDLRYQRVNDRLAELNGIPAEAHIGRTVQEVVPHIAPHAVPQLRRIVETGEPILDFHASGETSARPGVRRDWVEHFWPVKDASGRVEGINVVVEEITERLRMEAIRRREEEFRSLAENSGDAISRFDRNLCRVYANPAAGRLYGRSREAMIGKTNVELGLPQDFAAGYDRLLREALASGQVMQAELVLPGPDGGCVVESQVIPEVGADGTPETVLAIARDVTDRRRTAEALRASERRYRQLVETLNEGIWAIDKAGSTTFVNGRMAAMLGYGDEEMLGRALFDFMDEQGRDSAERHLERRRAGVSEEHDFEFLRKDGTRIYVRMNTSPLHDSEGNYEGALAGMVDVTARRRAEEALRESEARFRQVVELVPSVLYRVPLPGYRAEFISPEVERLIGFTREEWAADPNIWVRQLHEQDRERVLAEMETALRHLDSYTQQYRIWHKDGRQLRWLEDRHRIERDAQGRAVALFGVMIDITDRKQAEEALHRREEEFRALAERSPDVVARIGADLRFLYVNPAVERAMGRPPAFFVGRTVREAGLSQSDAAVLVQDVEAALRDGRESLHEYSFPSPDGRERFFECRVVPEFGPDGEIQSVITVSRDITRLREVETQVRQKVEELARANERLQALSRHDPLTGLANRRYLADRLENEWRREARHDHTVALIIADIDHFKAFNDHYGHMAGDECLRRVARVLQHQVHRPGDLLARYGGEEFVVLLPETTLSGAERLAETMRRAVEDLRLEHHAAPGWPFVTISVGVAEVFPRRDSSDELFARADRALYRAKAAGRNCVVTATTDGQ